MCATEPSWGVLLLCLFFGFILLCDLEFSIDISSYGYLQCMKYDLSKSHWVFGPMFNNGLLCLRALPRFNMRGCLLQSIGVFISQVRSRSKFERSCSI